AEDHVLMLADERPEGVVIAGSGAMEIRVVGREEKWGGGGHLRLYTEKSGLRMQKEPLNHKDTKDTKKISLCSLCLCGLTLLVAADDEQRYVIGQRGVAHVRENLGFDRRGQLIRVRAVHFRE